MLFLTALLNLPCSVFFLFSFTNTITMKAWFRALAAAFKSPAPATAVAGLSTLILVLYTGYSLPEPYMIGALKWIRFINVSYCPARNRRVLLRLTDLSSPCVTASSR